LAAFGNALRYHHAALGEPTGQEWEMVCVEPAFAPTRVFHQQRCELVGVSHAVSFRPHKMHSLV
jgi:hypothetical protein